MFYLTAEHSFDSAHFLKGYQGKCSNLHGHRWRVVVQVKGDDLCPQGQIRGMVLDFGEVKAAVRSLCDHFDHATIYEEGSLASATVQALEGEGFRLIAVPFRPTAEELARHFCGVLTGQGYPVCRVEVYETPTNCAIYEV